MGEAVSAGKKAPYALPERIAKGRRNEELFRFACSMQARGRSDSEMVRELARANRERCDEPLPDAELTDILRKVTFRYEKGTPRAPRAEESGGGPLAKLGRSSFNDKDLSRAFAEMYRDRLRYVPEAKCWYAYDGTRWADGMTGGEQIAQRLMKEFSDKLCDAAVAVEDEERRAKAMKGAARYCQQNARSKLLEDCKSELCSSISEFDRHDKLFNCLNGTLDLASRVFRDHDPADMLTRVAGCDYDKEAGYAGWTAFLDETLLGDGELVGFMQRTIGAALAADNSDERFYIAQGLTRTGKSTTLETIMAMMGDYGCTIQPETLQDAKRSSQGASGDIARMKGARFIVCPEPRKNMRLDVALVKQLTGGDMVTARNLFKGEFSFRPRFQLWVNTNYLPEVNDPTLFESQRVVVVPFNNRREEGQRDTRLKERMREPSFLSGVLNWAVNGNLMRFVSLGAVPSVCLAATEKYRSDSDRFAEFIAEHCETGTGLREDGARLYESYVEWTESEGCGTLKKQLFFGELERRDGIRKAGRGTVRGKDSRNMFTGIRLRMP